MLDVRLNKLVPAQLNLAPGEVHVWLASLDRAPHEVQLLRSLLCAREQTRAAQFHFDQDRRRFAVRRALLRLLLGHYLAQDPLGLEFHYQACGKPTVPQDPCQFPLRFNLSHSRDLALYAIASGRELGVDIECICPFENLQHVAERFFSRVEYATLRSLPESQQLAAFFRCWTRQEAFLKAIGTGLLSPPNPHEHPSWTVQAIELKEDYAAAVAIEGADCQLRTFSLPDCLS